MKMNKNEISQFDKMMKECRLEDAVSDEFKHFQRKRKKVIYKSILVRLGIYSSFTGVGVSLFFGIKKISAIIGTKLLIGSLVVATSVSSVIIYKIVKKTDIITIQHDTDQKSAAIQSPGQPEKKAALAHYTLGLQSFNSGSVNKETLDKVNRYMLQSFKTTGNVSYAAFLTEIGEDRAAYIVNQSIEKVNNAYYIQIKIIDKNTSAIVFASKGTAESENSLQDACNDLARQVITAVK
jgi:hypothetical protein